MARLTYINEITILLNSTKHHEVLTHNIEQVPIELWDLKNDSNILTTQTKKYFNKEFEKSFMFDLRKFFEDN